jgi:hypothetical protein
MDSWFCRPQYPIISNSRIGYGKPCFYNPWISTEKGISFFDPWNLSCLKDEIAYVVPTGWLSTQEHTVGTLSSLPSQFTIVTLLPDFGSKEAIRRLLDDQPFGWAGWVLGRRLALSSELSDQLMTYGGIRKQIRKRMKKKLERNGWTIWELGKCSSEVSNLENLIDQNPMGSLGQIPPFLAEWYLNFRNAVCTSMSPLAKRWSDSFSLPYIPFEKAKRGAIVTQNQHFLGSAWQDPQSSQSGTAYDGFELVERELNA